VGVRAALLNRALVSGTLAAAAVTLVASLAARRATSSSAAALNATGFMANYGASIFWALFYEALGKGRPRSPARALLDGALISVAAYVTDYHLIPRRLTPGFEIRVPRAALACVYAALALGLSLRDLCSNTSFSPPTDRGSQRRA
jgi:hypothetical protein